LVDQYFIWKSFAGRSYLSLNYLDNSNIEFDYMPCFLRIIHLFVRTEVKALHYKDILGFEADSGTSLYNVEIQKELVHFIQGVQAALS